MQLLLLAQLFGRVPAFPRDPLPCSPALGIQQRLKGKQAGHRCLREHSPIFLSCHAQMVRHFRAAGRAPHLHGQFLSGPVQTDRLLPHLTRQPVLVSGQVYDHAPQALGDIGLEFHVL